MPIAIPTPVMPQMEEHSTETNFRNITDNDKQETTSINSQQSEENSTITGISNDFYQINKTSPFLPND